uniref:Retrovirus-related Pol polyprotein from transposon TNT 1-94 n=1 Tax=Cajanus cajan TaxID=3821 RepID=A0A151T077_CAJCA|nr:Retrovirus-related Pol polyprotein from transposon TNT 1-94 [Cajanus cajan]
MKLCFGGDKLTLVGYSNSYMVGDIDSKKSTSGYLIKFVAGAMAWQSRLQRCVTLSTTEAEFIAITKACKELLWLKKFLQELGFVLEKYPLFVDSQSVIHLGKNPTFHSRSKHIDVRYHWIRCVATATCGDLVILSDHGSVNLVSDESMWIVDSGATLHVTPWKEFFTSYTSGDFGVLKMGNDGVSKVIGVGDVFLQTNMGMQLLLRGVKHAPDVCFNLISV